MKKLAKNLKKIGKNLKKIGKKLEKNWKKTRFFRPRSDNQTPKRPRLTPEQDLGQKCSAWKRLNGIQCRTSVLSKN